MTNDLFAEKWGLGIPNAMHEFVEHGLLEPKYMDWDNAVKVTVRRRSQKGLPVDATVNDTVSVVVKGPVNGPERLFDVIKRNPGLRKAALAELSGLSARTVKRYVETVLAKRIEFRGAPKTGGYYCN